MTAPIRPTTAIPEYPVAHRPGSLRAAVEPAARITAGFTDRAERDRIVAWLDAGLRPGRPGRLAHEYPLLFEPASEAVPITLWSGTRPSSFCYLWPTRFAFAGGMLRTALVSLVYTDPRDRSQGFARRVLARALREARVRELGLCLLWSELVDFYATQGFTRAGHECLLTVDADVLGRARVAPRSNPRSHAKSSAVPNEAARGATSIRVERATAADWPAISALRTKRRCHVALADGGSVLAGIPELDVRVARGAQGVVAFAMCGRGDDFCGVIHEWAGEPEAVLRCCDALVDAAGPGNGLLLLSPDEPGEGDDVGELGWRLRSAGAQRLDNPLAWFAVSSLPALAADLAGLAPSFARAIRLEDVDVREGGAPAIALVERALGERRLLSPAELVALLFSKPSDPTAAAARARIAAIAPASVLTELPLPLFVWGLESI